MCGITGAVGRLSHRTAEAAPTRGAIASCVDRMSVALQHRGPDGEAFLAIRHDGAAELRRTRDAVGRDEHLAGLLVHRRLSIIDLVTGDQPMAVDQGQSWIV